MLVFTQAVWAAPIPAINLSPTREVPNFLQIEIPDELASVDDVYEAPASLDPKVLLHIQNVHGNYSAQVQIKKMLQYFYEKYGFNTIFVEGATEKLDTKYLELFPDQSDNQALAEDLAKKGHLTGPELYLMAAPQDVRAIGIEQPELYRGNYEAFKTVYANKKEADTFLKLVSSRLELLSSRFLTRDMRRVLSEWQKFHEGRREFMPFVNHLAEESQKFLNLDLNSLFAQVEWPQTARLLVLQSMEADLKEEEALAERDKLLAFLEEHHASDTLIQGLEKMEEKTISLQRLSSSRDNDPFQPRKLLELLAEEATPMGFQFHQYPNFSLYAGYTILESELDSKLLFQEIEKLFARILESLTVSEKEKNLLELYKDIELLKKLMALELTRTEWDQVTYRKDWIKPESLVERLDKMSESGFVTESLTVTKKIPMIFDAANKFYDFARQREFAFYDTIEHEMKLKKTDRAILVTGGFHTDGLSDIFRSKQISYGVLTPRMGGDFDKTGYIQTLMESHPTIFDLAQMEMVNTLQSLVSQAEQGLDPTGAVQVLLDSYIARFEQKGRSAEVKARDTKALTALIEAYNKAVQYGDQGAGFQRLPTDDGRVLYWYRTPVSVTQGQVTLGPLVNSKGQAVLFAINPNFKGGQAVVLDGIDVSVLRSMAGAQKIESVFQAVPSQTASRSSSAEGVVLNLPGASVRARVLTEGGAPTRLSPEAPDLNLLFSRPKVFTEQQRVIGRPSFVNRLDKADKLAEAGKFTLVPVVLTATFRDRASLDAASLHGFIDLMSDAQQAGQHLVDFIDQADIPEPHKRVLKFILQKSSKPGALIIRLDQVPNALDVFSSRLKNLLEENQKQYLSVILPDGLSSEQTSAAIQAFDSIKKSDAGLRFNVYSPERLGASEVFRLMITVMQRIGDLKNGSVYNHIRDHGAFFSETSADHLPEEWVSFYAKLLYQETLNQNDSRIPAENGPEFYAQLLALGVSLAVQLSQIDPAEVDQNLLKFLFREDEKTYQLNEDAVLGLVVSMLTVWAAYDKALSASA